MPPKSKASTPVNPRRSSRAVGKKSTPTTSAKSTAGDSAAAITPSSSATIELSASLTSPKTEQFTAEVSVEASHQAPATTPPTSSTVTSPEVKKSPAKSDSRSSSGDLTPTPVITTQTASGTNSEKAELSTGGSPNAGEQVAEKESGISESSTKQAARSDNVDGGVLKTAAEDAAQGGLKKTTGKTVVKRTVRVVKKLVKKKVQKKVEKGQAISSNEGLEKKPVTATDGGGENPNPNSSESVKMEVEDHKPNPSVLGVSNVENLKSSESVKMEAEDHNPRPSVFSASNIENLKSSEYVKMEVESYNPEPDPPVTLRIEKPNDDGSMEVENTSSKPSSAAITIENPHATVSCKVENPELPLACEDRNDGLLVSNDNEVANGESFLASDIQLEDKKGDLISVGNDECETKNMGSGDGEAEEGAEEEVENSETGVSKRGVGMDGLVLSPEMEAMERRRRRKTEVFIGGLDKDTKEEDIRKAFEDGEIVEMRLMLNCRDGKAKGFAFVRFATADDAKKALDKHSKVEICGKQCGVSLVKGNDTIFLGNIDKKWKSEDVCKLLRDTGIDKIDKVTVIADPDNLECNRGFAFLELETTKDAQDAYKKLQKKDVFGKNPNIKVAWAEPLNEPDEEEMLKVKSVYAEYIPSSWDEGKVRDCFKKFGEVENVVLARNLRSSRRKDFAFVNYATREAALACIDTISRESLTDDGSKVNIKVSLAKPQPKVKQIKHTSNPTTKDSSQAMLKMPQHVIRPKHEARNKEKSSTSKNENVRVDRRSSTTTELVHLLREQASWRQPHVGSGRGSLDMVHPYSAPERKRPFSALGDDSLYLESRQNSRARVGGSLLVPGPSALPHGLGTTSFPNYHRQGADYALSSLYRVEDHPDSFQTRRPPPPYGSSSLYHRY